MFRELRVRNGAELLKCPVIVGSIEWYAVSLQKGKRPEKVNATRRVVRNTFYLFIKANIAHFILYLHRFIKNRKFAKEKFHYHSNFSFGF